MKTVTTVFPSTDFEFWVDPYAPTVGLYLEENAVWVDADDIGSDVSQRRCDGVMGKMEQLGTTGHGHDALQVIWRYR